MSLAEVIKNKNLSLFRPNDNFEFDKQDKSDYNYCCCREQIGLQAKTFTVDCLGHIMTIPVGRVGPGQCIRSVIWHIFEIQSSSRALLSIFSYI